MANPIPPLKSGSIWPYTDYLSLAEIIDEANLPSQIDDVLKDVAREMSARLGASVNALMTATSGTGNSESAATLDYSYANHRPPTPYDTNLRLTNIIAPSDPVARSVTRTVLRMATLETRRRFLEE